MMLLLLPVALNCATILGTTVANYLVSTGPVRTWQAFTGQTTIEQMARFQGHSATTEQAAGVIEARLTRTPDGWSVTRLTLA